MIIESGYIYKNKTVIYKTLKEIKELIEKKIITDNIKDYKKVYYVTYNDGKILIPPEDSYENILKKCEEIKMGIWKEEAEIIINIENDNIKDFYNAYTYLTNHIIFNNNFLKCLDIEVVKVNPKTLEIDNDKSLNTKVQIWLECGPYVNHQITHDIDLDCGGNNFESAIIELADLVHKYYGDDEKYALEKIKNKYN